MKLHIRLYDGREFKTLYYQNIDKFKFMHGKLVIYLKEDTRVYTWSLSDYTVEDVLQHFNKSNTPRWHSFIELCVFIEECRI